MADDKSIDYENSLRPLTPKALADYGELEKAVIGGDFSFSGQWTNSYRIYAAAGAQWYKTYRGYLTIAKQDSHQRDVLKLSIGRNILLPYQTAYQKTLVEMLCNDDEYGRPTDWTLDNTIADFSGSEDKICSRYNEISRLAGALLVKDYVSGRVTTRYNGLVSSDISLMAVVQKYGKEPPLDTFMMLEELDKAKPGQMISYLGTEKFDMGGRAVETFRYQQTGFGTLPKDYYVDSRSKRLLILISGQEAYILDDSYIKTHEKAVDYIKKGGFKDEQ